MSLLVWPFRPCPPCQRFQNGLTRMPGWRQLDQKMYLRHVGRDGCVDVDLATYYIGPQMAKRTVLLQVSPRAASLPFGMRIRSSSGFPSKVWSGRRWLWTTICSTSSKRRWLPLDVLLPVGPEKSDSRLLWSEGA